MTVKRIAYWIVFAIAFVAFQGAGFLSLTFGGVHSDTVPLLLGLVFLLPAGTLIPLLILPWYTVVSVVVVVNLVAWLGLKSWWQKGWRPAK